MSMTVPFSAPCRRPRGAEREMPLGQKKGHLTGAPAESHVQTGG
jgi:hypothetical protein